MSKYEGFTIDEDKRDEFEAIKLALKGKGIDMLLEQIQEHRSASDTVKITAIMDTEAKNIVSTTSEELLKRQGYVLALDWVLFIVDFYRNFEDNRDDL